WSFPPRPSDSRVSQSALPLRGLLLQTFLDLCASGDAGYARTLYGERPRGQGEARSFAHVACLREPHRERRREAIARTRGVDGIARDRLERGLGVAGEEHGATITLRDHCGRAPRGDFSRKRACIGRVLFAEKGEYARRDER